MTAAEILKELRDIELPENAGGATADGFAIWPFAILVVGTLLVAGVRWHRSNGWRRDARSRLREIDGFGDPALRWAAMIELLRQIGKQASAGMPPPAIFRRSESVRADDVAALRAHLGGVLKR